jgi:hypothetical protein
MALVTIQAALEGLTVRICLPLQVKIEAVLSSALDTVETAFPQLDMPTRSTT